MMGGTNSVPNKDRLKPLQLMEACRDGNTKYVQHLLKKPGIKIDQQNDKGHHALTFACMSGNSEVVELLLKAFPYPQQIVNLPCSDGTTSLMIACQKKLTVVVSLLLQNGADVNLQQSEGWSSLMSASRNGHTETALMLLQNGADVNLQQSEGLSPLMFASWNKHTETALMLLQNGADVNLQQSEGLSPLMFASWNKHTETALMLLQNGADVNLQQSEGWSSLMIASQNGHTETALMLLQNGADVNLQQSEGWSPLTFASQNGHTETALMLLQNGADVNLQQIEGWSPLMFASRNGHTETALMLLQNGADVDLQNKNRSSSLMKASQNGHTETALMLLQNGADVDLQNKNRSSSLMKASQNGHTETALLLLQNGADVNLQQNEGWSPLMFASRNGHTETALMLLQNGADVNLQQSEGWSPLMKASQNGHTETALMLLQNGADVNLQKSEGGSSLMIASQNGHTETALMLLQNGADVNLQQSEGGSSLMIASQNGCTETALMLLQNGADVNLQQSEGWSPLMFASRNGRTETALMLLQNGADVNLQQSEGWSPLMFASRNGHTETALMLLQNGADVNLQQSEGWSSLMSASRNGHTETALMLLQNGADVNLQQSEGGSSLMIASQNGHTETALMLLQNGADVNLQQSEGGSSLMIASQNGHTETALMLLQNGADVNLQQSEGGSSLMIASQNGHTETVLMLLQNGADVDLQNKKRSSSLMKASQNGHTETALMLLQNGADVDLQNKNRSSSLMKASQNGHTETALMLLQNGADVNLQQSEGWSPLMFASRNGHTETALMLLQNGADVNLQQSEGWSSLMSASRNGHTETALMLLQNGADVDLQNKNRSSSLMKASQNGHTETALLLLQNGADVNLQQSEGWSPLMKASQNGHTETALMLLQNGADVNLQQSEGWSSLMIASQNGHTETALMLLQNGADVNLQQSEGWSSLMSASRNRHTETALMLLQNGADVNLQQSEGWSSLMSASWNGHTETALMLLQNGADVNLQQSEGWSPLMFASRNGHTETALMLFQNGADVNLQQSEGWSPLMFASRNGHTETALMLLQNGADVNLQQSEGWSSLMIASQNGHTETASLLLQHGADVNKQIDGSGMTSLTEASKNGHVNIVRLLLDYNAEVSIQTIEGESAATLARREGHTEIDCLLQDEEKSRSEYLYQYHALKKYEGEIIKSLEGVNLLLFMREAEEIVEIPSLESLHSAVPHQLVCRYLLYHVYSSIKDKRNTKKFDSWLQLLSKFEVSAKLISLVRLCCDNAGQYAPENNSTSATEFEGSKKIVIMNHISKHCATEGSSVLLEVQASASSKYPITAKWLKNGNNIDPASQIVDSYGGNHVSIVVVHVEGIQAEGTYTCHITQNKESVSVPIELSVITPLDKYQKSLNSFYSKPKGSHFPVRSIGLIIDHNTTNSSHSSNVIMDKHCLDYKEVFSRLESGARLLVVGQPGSGKTTLMQTVCQDWVENILVFSQARLLILVHAELFSDPKIGLNNIFSTYFHNSSDRSELAEYAEKHNGLGFCFILDGFDDHSIHTTPYFNRLLNREVFPKSVVIITSRPAPASDQFKLSAIQHIEILGFSKGQIYDYVKNYSFSSQLKCERVLKYFAQHPDVYKMCHLPFFTSIVCYLFHCLDKDFPQTETEIYEYFTKFMIFRSQNLSGQLAEFLQDHSIEELARSQIEEYYKICELAYKMCRLSEQTMSQSEIELEFLGVFGLVVADRIAVPAGFQTIYKFLHLSLQEFLCACYISRLQKMRQVELIKELGKARQMNQVWKFYCGLVKFDEQYEEFKLLVNHSDYSDLYKVQCAFESQQTHVCSEVVVNNSLSFSDTKLTSHFKEINFVLSNTVNPVYRLSLANCSIGQDSCLTGIVECLRLCADVQALNLSTNNLGDEGIKAVAVRLQHCSELRELNLESNTISSVGAKTLANYLKQSSTMQVLNLKSNKITVDGADVLTEALQQCSSLHTLSLENNDMDADSIKTFSDHVQYLVAYREVLKSSECIDMWFIKIILLGPPGLGKTTARLRLMGEIDDIISSGRDVQPSTGVVDSGHNVVIRNLVSSNALVTGSSEWRPIKGISDEVSMLLELFRAYFYGKLQVQQETPKKSPVGSATEESLPFPRQQTSTLSGIPQHSSTTSEKLNTASVLQPSAANITASAYIPSHSSRQRSLQVNVKPDLFSKIRKALNSNSWKEVADILTDMKLLRFEDTGGQPEFMDMLPALTIGPALYLLFCRLIDDLQECYSVTYRSASGESSTQPQSTYTVEEVLLSALASIDCMKSSMIGDFNSDQLSSKFQPFHFNQNSVAYIIGTHKDGVEDDQKIKEFDEKLQSSIRSAGFFKKDLVWSFSKERMVIPVDNMSGGKQEVKLIQNFLEEGIKEHFKKLSIPAAWLMLSLSLRLRKEKTASLESVLQTATDFCIPEDEVKLALWFLHHYAGVLMYFPNLPELADTVICDTQIVYDSATSLIISSFRCSSHKMHADTAEKFWATGQFSLEDILKATAKISGDYLPLRKLVKLLEHLNIIAPIDSDPTSAGQEYFMPCVLQNATQEELEEWWKKESSKSLLPPLFIRNKCGYMSIGVFPAMVASLVGKKDKGIKQFIVRGRKKNRVQFRFGRHHVYITLISQPKYYAVHIADTPDKSQWHKVCSAVRELVESTMETVTSRMNYSFKAKHQLAFECPECPLHPRKENLCVVDSDDHPSPEFMRCILNEDHCPRLNDHHKVWFKNPLSNTQVMTEIMEKYGLTEDDCSQRVCATHLSSFSRSHCSKWRMLPSHLGMEQIVADGISRTNTPEDEKRFEFLSRWKESKEATYKSLISALVAINCREDAESVCKLLKGSPC